MGTRAVVRMNGKFMLATHWDGYPDALGEELFRLSNKSASNVLRVSAHHSIDIIHRDFAPSKSIETQQTYGVPYKKEEATGIQTTVFKDQKDVSGGTLIRGEGYDTKKITSIIDNEKQYGDWAEYIYDIRDGKVYVAEGRGEYAKTLRAEKEGKLKFRKLGAKGKSFTINLKRPKGKKGWKRESVRHALARKGIKTGRKQKGFVLRKNGKIIGVAKTKRELIKMTFE